MVSKRQIAANRRNAKKSTGPRTPEGLAAIRHNNLKHGLSAQTLLIPGENESDFTDLLHSFAAEHQPATQIEEALVRQLAMSVWRLNRTYHFESSLYTGKTFDEAVRAVAALSLLQARLEGLFDRTLRALQQEMRIQSQSQNRTLENNPHPTSAIIKFPHANR
jgi:hypothetical protein